MELILFRQLIGLNTILYYQTQLVVQEFHSGTWCKEKESKQTNTKTQLTIYYGVLTIAGYNRPTVVPTSVSIEVRNKMSLSRMLTNPEIVLLQDFSSRPINMYLLTLKPWLALTYRSEFKAAGNLLILSHFG